MAKSEHPINAPNVILALLMLFAAIHAYQSFLSPQDANDFLGRFAFIPGRYGGVQLQKIIFPDGLWGDLWTPVSYMFLHADLSHLLVNGFWMLAFGSLLARRFGDARFLLFSLICGFAGIALHLLTHWGSLVPVIGASAAISGQMAAAARFIFSTPMGLAGAVRAGKGVEYLPALSLSALIRTPPAMFFLGIWLGINLIFGLGATSFGSENDIAWEAHIGGFAAGLLLFGWFDKPRKDPPFYPHGI